MRLPAGLKFRSLLPPRRIRGPAAGHLSGGRFGPIGAIAPTASALDVKNRPSARLALIVLALCLVLPRRQLRPQRRRLRCRRHHASPSATIAPAQRWPCSTAPGRCLFLSPSQVEALDAEPDAALDRQLDASPGARIPVWLTVPAPARIEDAEPWRASLRRLLERHGRGLTILEVRDRRPAGGGRRVFARGLRRPRSAPRTTRSASRSVAAAMIDAADREAIYTADMAPYVDLLVFRRRPSTAPVRGWSRTDPAAALIVSRQPSTGLVPTRCPPTIPGGGSSTRSCGMPAPTCRCPRGGRATGWRPRSNRWRRSPRC